jgi:hypothetical protein
LIGKLEDGKLDKDMMGYFEKKLERLDSLLADFIASGGSLSIGQI